MGILVFLFIFLVWGNSTVGPDLGSAWGQEPVTGPGAENQLGPSVEFHPKSIFYLRGCVKLSLAVRGSQEATFTQPL